MSQAIKTRSEVPIEEIDSVETPNVVGKDRPTIGVTPHWNRRELVILEIEGKKYTVYVNAVNKAIQNAQNAHEY